MEDIYIYIDGYIFSMGRSRGVCSIYNLARSSIEERDIRVAYFFLEQIVSKLD